MIGSCKTCKKRLNITKFDYSQGGCKHIKLDGYACLAFAGEREVVWMVGVNEKSDMCECYQPSDKDGETEEYIRRSDVEKVIEKRIALLKTDTKRRRTTINSLVNLNAIKAEIDKLHRVKVRFKKEPPT